MTARSDTAARLLLPLAVAVAVLLAPAAASAHTSLVGTSPAAGATVPADTGEVVLSFDAEVREQLARVVVTGPDGTAAAQGPARVRGTDVVQALRTPLPPGAWTVAYRVVADDGHPISGTLDFAVPGTAAAPTPAGAASPAPDPSPDARPPTASASVQDAPADLAEEPDDDTSLVLPAVGVLAVLVGGGALLARRVRRGRA